MPCERTRFQWRAVLSRLRRSLFPLLLVLAAGCGDSTGPDTNTRYVLQSMLGQLPYLVGGMRSGSTEITTGHILVNEDDSTCTISQTLRTTGFGIVLAIENATETCTWTEDGSDRTFTFPEDVVGNGSLVGDILTINYTVPPTDLLSRFIYERSTYVRL